jgi:uncharacterized ion transporter superfamily protein YfcC
MLDWLGRVRVPHVFTLLTAVVMLFSVLSWVIPAGSYERNEISVGALTRSVVVPGSFVEKERFYSLLAAFRPDPSMPESMAAPVSLQGFASAIPRGLEESADIVFFIFVMGGVFGILQATGTITATLGRLTAWFEHRVALLVILLTIPMAIGGSTLGMGEEFIPLAPIFILLSRRLGYDRLFGLSVVILAAGIGFAAATTNPFTVVIAQNIAELQPTSGWRLRVVFLSIAIVLTLIHILRYGARVKADPSSSLVADLPVELDQSAVMDVDFRMRHGLIIVACMSLFGVILYAVQMWGWWLNDMAGGFFLMGLVAAALGGLTADGATKAFIKGMEEMVVAALVVGFARGIVVVMKDAEILDTLIHAAASLLDGSSPYVGAVGMLFFQTVLNLFIPSGSGQAAVTMPLMAPLSDLLGITRQTAVLAFQCGDGFSNMIIPTSGSLMAMLMLGHVPYDRWLRFVMPLFVQLVLLSIAFLMYAVSIGYA